MLGYLLIVMLGSWTVMQPLLLLVFQGQAIRGLTGALLVAWLAVGPVTIWVGSLVWLGRRMSRGLLVFWVPLAAAAVAALHWWVSMAVLLDL